MKKTAVYIGMSLDGFIARKDGDIDWLLEFDSDDVTRSYDAFISSIDAILMGRGTFEKVLTFPTWLYNRHVYVLSNSLKSIPEKVRGKASLLSMPPAEALSFLSGKGVSSVYVDGGKVIQSFLREDLIDELTVTTVPVLIGEGIPLFGKLDRDLLFQHQSTDVLAGGLVESRYIRKRS